MQHKKVLEGIEGKIITITIDPHLQKKFSNYLSKLIKYQKNQNKRTLDGKIGYECAT